MVYKFSFLTAFLALFLLITNAQTLSAQTSLVSLKGVIMDSKNPLEGVYVAAIHKSSGTQYGVLTDKEGHFALNNVLPTGYYKICISYLGYQSIEQNEVALPEHGLDNYDVTLKEVSNILEVVHVKFDRKERKDAEIVQDPNNSLSNFAKRE